MVNAAPSRRAPKICASRDANSPEPCTGLSPPKMEGAGKAGCPMHPQPCVQNKKAHKRSHHRFTGTIRPSLRDGFNGVLRALPGDRALLPPSPAQCASIVANLTSASRCQDHTTLPSASESLVSRRFRVHRIPPNVRDDGQRPSEQGGMIRFYCCFYPAVKHNFGKSEMTVGAAEFS